MNYGCEEEYQGEKNTSMGMGMEEEKVYHEFVESRCIDGLWHEPKVVEQLPEIVLTQQTLFVPGRGGREGEGVRGGGKGGERR